MWCAAVSIRAISHKGAAIFAAPATPLTPANAYAALVRGCSQELAQLLALCEKFSARAFFVGGCVRDALLGRAVNDYDIELHGICPSELERFAAELGAEGVGAEFFVYKWRRFDIALARTERCTGARHRDFAVAPARTLEQAVQRRDFSINALLLDAANAELIDLCGGLADLAARRLLPVSERSFGEDALRVLRGVRFAAQLGFSLAPTAFLRAIDLSLLSPARVASEFAKLHAAPRPEIGLFYLLRLGHFELFAPAISRQQALRGLWLLGRARAALEREASAAKLSAQTAQKLLQAAVFVAFSLSSGKNLDEIFKDFALKKALAAAKRLNCAPYKGDLLALLKQCARASLSEQLLGYFFSQARQDACYLGVWEEKLALDFRLARNKNDASKIINSGAKMHLERCLARSGATRTQEGKQKDNK